MEAKPDFGDSVGKWPKDKDHKDGPGPVKAACLSCRQKKAKCDGVKPVCGQVSLPISTCSNPLTPVRPQAARVYLHQVEARGCAQEAQS